MLPSSLAHTPRLCHLRARKLLSCGNHNAIRRYATRDRSRPYTTSVAVEPAVPPVHVQITYCPGYSTASFRPPESPPPAYDCAATTVASPFCPAYSVAVDASFAPRVVEIAACVTFHKVPSPDGPTCTVTVPLAGNTAEFCGSDSGPQSWPVYASIGTDGGRCCLVNRNFAARHVDAGIAAVQP